MNQKIILTIVLALCSSSCQVQVNIGSTVNNLPPVTKIQYKSDGSVMAGSKIDDIAKGMKQESSATIPAIKK